MMIPLKIWLGSSLFRGTFICIWKLYWTFLSRI